VHCVVGCCDGIDDSAPIYFAPLCTSRRHCNGHCEAHSYPGLVQTSPINCSVIMFRRCAQRESDCRGQIVGTSTNSGGKLGLGGSSHHSRTTLRTRPNSNDRQRDGGKHNQLMRRLKRLSLVTTFLRSPCPSPLPPIPPCIPFVTFSRLSVLAGFVTLFSRRVLQ
jgi:hypothetical protein